MKNELISIIIPVYNVEKYFKECLDSIITQSYQNLEIILVDDGSTDASSQLCDTYMRQDSRIKVFHQKNQGVAGARNTGLEHATGTYIAFADPDDCCHSKQYELLYRALRESDSDIACCSYSNFADGDEKEDYSYDRYTQQFICDDNVLALFNRYSHPNPMGYAWNKLYKRDVIGNTRFPIGRHVQDFHFNLDVFAKTKRFIFITEKLYYYRQRIGSVLNKSGDNIKLSQDFVSACSHQIELFKIAGDESEFLSCLNNNLKTFAHHEFFAYYSKHDKSREVYRNVFISTFNENKKLIFKLANWKIILLARYALPLYHLVLK